MNFENIRPYNDSEYREVIQDLLTIKPLIDTVKNYLPELSIEQIRDTLISFDGIQEFQSKMVCHIIDRLMEKSVSQFSYNGLENVSKEKSHLFITNHRDIVLDSALVNYCLNDQKYDTCEIAIGSNLLTEPWIKKLVRLNKSFIVRRNLPKQEILAASKELSSYIDYTIKKKKQSIWIAQREGRAKDGFDKTNPGVLKMFGLASDGNLLEHLISLNITPVSLSYELDPCDNLKIPELIKKTRGEEYLKSPGEDEKSMLLGLTGQKGNIHVSYGATINEEIKQLSHIKNRNELLKKIAELIDQKIYKNYHLWNSNYVAHDLLTASKKYVHKYDEDGKEVFLDYMNHKLANFSNEPEARELFLKMYANPVFNSETVR